VTILGPLVVNIITGTLVVEQIFGIPGLGKYYTQSINNRDYTLIMGTTVFYAVLLLVSMFLVDIAYGLVDPRIRLGQGKE
ncbi:MAG: ABC transporter permease subunit, partial [Bacillota bacterium]